MQTLLRVSRAIDALNERIGRLMYWLVLFMVVIGVYNAVTRKLGQYTGVSLSSNAYLELQWYLFSLLFLWGAAYTLKHNAHVRVDVIYAQLSSRKRAWIDLLGAVFFLIPFSLLVIWVSWPMVSNSWAVLEVSPDPGGLPRYPIKTAIPVAFVLLLLQGVSEAIKRVAVLRGVLSLEEEGGEGWA
ncbi:TRAP transporter small permease subunit [Marinithermus hydrothermalis]|uniref:Tripartite ATP-independent periplasmic transporter DctQ component n=1 Tax=Marinithermus hydrothermalis (strain DSM 14884 / JCM 11576 / T1) TaxID=869210 RepID=F2NNN6_MARHT|nr:TRAP transporter small permease subunit [Marinithermus hydrothermalis]AEB11051.1 Tripartite ATP-independent periplasmic transporter DctQ component [Marinithermus hydrothermalis DSM 14884]